MQPLLLLVLLLLASSVVLVVFHVLDAVDVVPCMIMSTTTKPAVDSDVAHSAPLVEFLNTLPSPLTTTLVALAPSISRLRHALQILAWKAPWEECWLFLASWWAVCLVPELGLRCVSPYVQPEVHGPVEASKTNS